MEIRPFQKNLVSLILCSLSLPLTITFWDSPAILISGLAVLSSIILIFKGDKESIVIWLLGGFAGPLAEAAAISSGAWTYANPDILGVPFWLFPLWGLASLFIWYKGLLVREIVSRIE